jgi:putative flippase GtrA
MIKDFLKQFAGRNTHNPVVQFIKYGIGGCTATAVDIIVFYVLSLWVIQAVGPDDIIIKYIPVQVQEISDAVRANRFTINSSIAFLFSNLTAYLINIFWVFEPGRHKWYVEMGLFYLVSGIAIVIGTALGWVAINFFGWSTTISFGTKAIAALMINYVARNFFIFKG